MTHLKWAPIIARAATIVRSYATPVTLRQLFYRLVAAGLIPNDHNAYKYLSEKTAAARRTGAFPSLVDLTREVQQAEAWTSPESALLHLALDYRVDRTQGQPYQVWLGVEKATLAAQVDDWFGDRLGLPVLVLRGYASQSLVDAVRRKVITDGRPAVLLYAGDHDPSGEDILRDFVERTGCWYEVRQVAVTAAQVDRFGLVRMPGKARDSRAAQFIADHGGLFQVEVEALDPNDLRDLFADALDEWWDPDAYVRTIEREQKDQKRLAKIARKWRA